MLKSLLRESRPKQWVKNVLVFAAPGALGDFGHGHALEALIMFLSFCLASSGTYFWNDIFDVEEDRLHPKKKFRPIANGDLSLPVARTAGTLLLLVSILLPLATRPAASGVVVLYVLLTISYSTYLKNIVLIDLFLVSSGFLLRAIGGAVATDTKMSKWFVLCTAFGSLFIVAGKRFAEYNEMGSLRGKTREVLDQYSDGLLRMLVGISATAMIVSYCLWAFESAEALKYSGIPYFELSIIPMVVALFRYILLLEKGEGGAPEEIFVGDRHIQFYGLIWIVVYGLGVYVK
jgi:decaprenyl-phosphate phosphoribosyltransferase